MIITIMSDFSFPSLVVLISTVDPVVSSARINGRLRMPHANKLLELTLACGIIVCRSGSIRGGGNSEAGNEELQN